MLSSCPDYVKFPLFCFNSQIRRVFAEEIGAADVKDEFYLLMKPPVFAQRILYRNCVKSSRGFR